MATRLHYEPMASLTTTNIPTCLWAQRKDCVYVTVDVPDCKDEEIVVADDKLTFKATSGDKNYACEMVLHAGINAEGSKYAVKARNVTFYLEKADAEADSWPRLLKDKALNKRFCKVDFDKWVDSDEEDGADGFDTDGMQGMGGPPGMGGMGMPGMGMPGMGGGPGGGAGGMDMAALQKMMAQMGGGAGGAGGAGGMDLASMMGGAGGMPGMPGMGGADADGEPDSDDDLDDLDDMPDLEEEDEE